MKLQVKIGNVNQISSDMLIVGLFKDTKKLSGAIAAVDSMLKGIISSALVQNEIEGKLGESLLFHSFGRIAAKKVLVVGMGERKKFNLDSIRTASASAIRQAQKLKTKQVISVLHGEGEGVLDIEDCAAALVEGAILGSYKFEGYKTGKDSNPSFRVKEFTLVEGDHNKISKIKAGVRQAEICASAQNNARDLVAAPANKMTPTAIANYAQKMARSVGISCKISDPHKLKFGAMLSVSEGSKDLPKVVILKYHHSPKAETIGLVGKGVTFDSGGISIKPSRRLWEMKTDMSGAAAVIEVMRAAAQLKVRKNIIAVIPLCENMPDGKAARPGDVITSYSGKTIEIISTDAEGRMLLIDSLNYAQKLGATRLVDVATLTGGCVVALGDVASGIMGNVNHKIVEEILEASKITGEKMWELPLYDEYKEYLKSDIADFKNCSEGRGASASTGGVFVSEVVGKTPWAHIDIAGTAFLHHSRGCLGAGATGTPVRTLVRWLAR
ncbi:MAG: leucyl aminopeptidase [Candidatus Saganbacteria bacterium]|nr:leucyl aminopeptidase [Candidatus Saganbacteria bacterium]